MANQFLQLSLFLMLLSFFIVLNAVSDFEDDKSRPVLNSIALAFSNHPDPNITGAADNDIQTILEEKREGDTLEALKGLFNAHISAFEAKKNRLGTVMHVRVPVGRFRNAIDFPSISYSDAMIGMQGSFLPTMITLLRSAEHGEPYRMDIILNVAQDPSVYLSNQPGEFAADLRILSGFATSLERSGMPKKMISIGMEEGDSSYLDLYFYQYKPFDLMKKIQRKGSAYE